MIRILITIVDDGEGACDVKGESTIEGLVTAVEEQALTEVMQAISKTEGTTPEEIFGEHVNN